MRTFAQIPSASRKVCSPDSRLIPAPVRTVIGRWRGISIMGLLAKFALACHEAESGVMASESVKTSKPAAKSVGASPQAAARARLLAAFEPLSDRLLGVSAKESEVYGYFNSTDSEELLAKHAPFSAGSPLLRLGKEAARLLESIP